MADPKIRIRRSATPNKVPLTSQLQLGELAINTFDGKLYLEKDQTGSSGIATVIVVNPWSVGLGSLAYDTFFTAGNVGVGTTVPTQLLDVAGDIRLRGAIFDSNNTTGTANQILVSRAGAGVSWANITSIPVGDANTLDGLDSTQFLRSDADDTATGLLTLSGGINVSAASTFTGPITIGNTMSFGDNDRLRIGDGNDLQIFHNALDSWIQNSAGGGNLKIAGDDVEILSSGGASKIIANTGAEVGLYYNGILRLETSGIGVTIYNRLDVTDINASGVITATSFIGDGSGIFNLPGATVGVDTNTTNQAQIIPFALGYGSTTGFGATDGLVFNPSTTRLGIGSDAPAYSLDVVGDINSSTDVKINGTGVLDTALALAIALG
jgi:hypothetical protein